MASQELFKFLGEVSKACHLVGVFGDPNLFDLEGFERMSFKAQKHALEVLEELKADMLQVNESTMREALKK